MISNNKIKILLVTGFLGSGKTTLLNKVIEFYKSKKIALVINDFGKIAVDGILLSDQINNDEYTKIYEIANGSIFCSCLTAELVESLKYFTEINPEVLIIETSGLSDPSSFEKILLENQLDKYYEIDKSICVVDSTNVLKLHDQITVIEKQIASSNLILTNKSDLINKEEYLKVKDFVKLTNKNAVVLKTEFSHFDLSRLEEFDSSKLSAELLSCNTVSNRPGSIVLEQKELSRNEIEKFFNGIAKYVLRLKGFLKIENQSFYISDSNLKLQFEKYNQNKITDYGLSVLLKNENVTMIKKAWNLL